MQLTGTASRARPPRSATTSRRSPTSRPRSARPPARCPGVSGFQIHFADHDILTPGDQPDVLVAMNPAALKTNLKDLRAGGTLIVNRDAFNDRNLQKAGYADEPARGRHARRLQGARDPADDDDGRGAQGHRGRDVARGRALEELLRARADVVALRPAVEATLDFIEAKFGKRPEIAEANTRAFKAGLNYGETSEDFVVSYEVQAGEARARARTGNITGNQALVARARRRERPERAAALPRRVPDHAGVGDPRGARALQALRRPHVPGRGRDRGRRRGARRLVRRRARRHAPRPARASCSRRRRSGSRSCSSCRSLIIDVQRAGPSTGMPTKPEQADLLMVLFGRNSESPVPVIARVDARRLLRHGDRGRADRAQVPDARLPALRRVPRERLRAVADPGRGDAARLSTSSSRPTPNAGGQFLPVRCATRRRSRGRGRSPARPASSTGSAGSRRQDVHRQRLLRPRQPRPRWSGCARRRSPGSPRDIPELEVDDPDGAELLVLGWGGTYGPIAAGVRAACASDGRQRSRTRTCAT